MISVDEFTDMLYDLEETDVNIRNSKNYLTGLRRRDILEIRLIDDKQQEIIDALEHKCRIYHRMINQDV